MMPEQWTGGSFPSVVMGDVVTPALIYYWNASRGVQVLRSTGRATQKPTGDSFGHHAQYRDGKWTVVLEVPSRSEGTPLAFAVWDGRHQDRDGLKFFSVWYALEGK
jgi:DMSO reductase family type II enzyme heme b subunit